MAGIGDADAVYDAGTGDRKVPKGFVDCKVGQAFPEITYSYEKNQRFYLKEEMVSAELNAVS